jgi:hypothetical protein
VISIQEFIIHLTNSQLLVVKDAKKLFLDKISENQKKRGAKSPSSA